MRSKKYLWNICMEIYREMYRQATPSADFDQLIQEGVTMQPNWFMNYYLPLEKQEEIVDKFCKQHRCDRYETQIIRQEIFLGCSPTSVKKEKVH